jgi:histone H3/H4
MKKIHTTKSNTPAVSQHRSFRRFVKKMFANFLKRQRGDGQDEFQLMVLEKLQDIGDSIEIMACEMARHAKRTTKVEK